jgi:N-acetylmuramoyl-L-alanine amidase
MAVKKTGRLINIAIDAGHGGEDPGAKGPQGTWEKDVTLAIAQRLRDRIEQEPNMRAILIRDGDFFIPLQTRVIKARRGHADLFISIHADAYTNPEARGSSVFALSERGATSVAAKWLARKENQADLIGGVNIDVPDPYLKQTLLDLSQTATINDSLKLARAMLSELSNVNRLHKNTIEQAGFAVLKSPDIPSILVETAFITNPEEELKLITDTYQSKMAEAIFNGIKKYLGTNPALAREVSLKNIKSPK